MPNSKAELGKLCSVRLRIKEDPYSHTHARNLAVIGRQTSIFERWQA